MGRNAASGAANIAPSYTSRSVRKIKKPSTQKKSATGHMAGRYHSAACGAMPRTVMTAVQKKPSMSKGRITVMQAVQKKPAGKPGTSSVQKMHGFWASCPTVAPASEVQVGSNGHQTECWEYTNQSIHPMVSSGLTLATNRVMVVSFQQK